MRLGNAEQMANTIAQSASMDESLFEESMEFVHSCAWNGTVHDNMFASPDDAGVR